MTTLTAADDSPISLTGGLGMTVGGKQASGDAQFLIAPFNPQASAVSGPVESVFTLDLTGASPAARRAAYQQRFFRLVQLRDWAGRMPVRGRRSDRLESHQR